MLIDTHAHLQWSSFDEDRDEVIIRAREAAVKYIVNIGFDLEGSRRAIKLAEKNVGFYATIGIHPNNVSQMNESALEKLRKLAKNPKVVAIGEIGLDYYRSPSTREAQKKAFEAQLFLAEELELPIVVHDRNAHADTLEILLKFKRKVKGIMHCFSGNREMGEQYIKSDFYISFSGTVTFPNSHNLHEIVKGVSLDKILIETDCPWLAPQNVRGKRNEPAFLTFIAKKIAELKSISFEEISEATTKNARKIFQLTQESPR